jgi:6-pyruvoyltetrahydropterin/6-carboxytetrahydropterin synthase
MGHGLKIKTSFDSAHWLPNYDGPCAQMHGHTWHVEIDVRGPNNPETGMLVDFTKLKPVINACLPDHKTINDFVTNPTAENISEWLFFRLAKAFTQAGFRINLRSVTLWETEKNAAYFEG